VHLQSSAHPGTDEYRRYFPDWTHRLLRVGQEIEADHNSYLAGGYAEEFGYLAQSDASRGVPLLDGESADECIVRLVQGAAMHPGYPLRPYPVVAEREEVALRITLTEAPQAPSQADGEKRVDGEARDHGGFIRVTERAYEREHRQPAHRAAAVATRLMAALVALRWEFPSRR